jgi:putative membrane protein
MTLAELLPTVNACLNTLSAVLLSLGYVSIRQGARDTHKRLMLAALGTSTVFLLTYLVRSALTGMHHFPELGVVKTVYLVLLSTHMLCAMVVVPLVLLAVIAALQERFDRHRRIVRWAWPIWMYVSVTGVLVYAMLYHLAPALVR